MKIFLNLMLLRKFFYDVHSKKIPRKAFNFPVIEGIWYKYDCFGKHSRNVILAYSYQYRDDLILWFLNIVLWYWHFSCLSQTILLWRHDMTRHCRMPYVWLADFECDWLTVTVARLANMCIRNVLHYYFNLLRTLR